jgi:hypothetical protein
MANNENMEPVNNEKQVEPTGNNDNVEPTKNGENTESTNNQENLTPENADKKPELMKERNTRLLGFGLLFLFFFSFTFLIGAGVAWMENRSDDNNNKVPFISQIESNLVIRYKSDNVEILYTCEKGSDYDESDPRNIDRDDTNLAIIDFKEKK